MYSLNVNLATTAANAVNSLLMVDSACTTPRTPEILNSLIAMTSPLDGYFGDVAAVPTAAGTKRSTVTMTMPGGDQVDSGARANSLSLSNTGALSNSDSNSSSCSQQDSPSRCTAATTFTSTTTPYDSVQKTCSQLIKAGLKLTIEQKRKLQSDPDDGLLDLDQHHYHDDHHHDHRHSYAGSNNKRTRLITADGSESDDEKRLCGVGLTPEDEDRRRRRRERNKIAATKCRLKKRERTANLVCESEVLENQNKEYKAQVSLLRKEEKQLQEILRSHRAICARNIQPPSRDHLFTRGTAHGNNNTFNNSVAVAVADNNANHSSFNNNSRPTSVDSNGTAVLGYNGHLRQATQLMSDGFNSRPSSTDIDVSYQQHQRSTNLNQYNIMKAPSIIIESEEDYTPQITDLDNHASFNNYNSQQCHANYGNNNSQNFHGLDDGGCMA